MVTPVFITQIEDGEETVLSEQIHSLQLKDTASISIPTLNTYCDNGMTPSSLMASTDDSMDDVFPEAVLSSEKAHITPLTSDSGPPLHSPVVHRNLLDINDYRAKKYYESTCKMNPKVLLAMAHNIINPKTGFPLLPLDGEPFCSFHQKKDYMVGNAHLISEITRRAVLDPNWVGIRYGNNDLPLPKSWSKSKCLMWLSTNPILNVDDYQYIVDSTTELIQSVSLANQQCLMYDSNRAPKSKEVPDAMVSYEFQFPENRTSNNCQVLHTSKTSNESKPKNTALKKTGLMDPGTFKLVLEHQKEYSLPLANLPPDKAALNQKKLWDTFWPKLQATSKKKKRSVKYVWKKKELKAEKARIDFLDKIHDLKTPML